MIPSRVSVAGKFFRTGAAKWFVRGFSYGPFAPNSAGEHLPDVEQMRRDFAHIRSLGGNCIRVYLPPPPWLLDEALAAGLRVFVDVPWEKHRCFFEDWHAQQQALASVRETARVMGNHPAVFALSVGNEIPVDIVRFYGARRIQRFVNRMIDEAKQQAPDCPATYVSFPTTEFLNCDNCDFYCFNVYVHDAERLGVYLDKLQHIAGNKPLVLGEYGIDTLREGDAEQAYCLDGYVQTAARRGLAGAFVFAYTDDWFTGGHQIDDWAFGVTDRQRREKSSAQAVRKAWRQVPPVPDAGLPSVSVVVCSYNGGQTITGCLESLMNLDYPDYEVILIDDGSTDHLPEIAEQFPQVFYHRQSNRGLSAARNAGARLARGEIVAYTDDDCVVDEHWLTYLVQAMQDQQVEAIGGPNIAPPGDGWIARCVAASPGNPSHVMLDDIHAEHVPGCNLAVHRKTLLGIGGFDTQFRVAGDDVDFCWRLLDAGLHIGYAPGAVVWHHRRPTVARYAQQQKGYGRSEAMVHFKHPRRCAAFGRNSWNGIIYGEGAVGLPLMPDRIYHGQFGFGLFQTIYRHNHYGLWSVMLSLEWHLTALLLVLLAYFFRPLLAITALMEIASLGLAIRSGWLAPLPRQAPWWTRPLVVYLYLMQPVWRGWHRLTHLLKTKRLPAISPEGEARRISATIWDLHWDHAGGRGRSELLPEIVGLARRLSWGGDFDNAWADWDIKLIGDRWHNIHIRTATEELGWPRRFTRARCSVLMTQFGRFAHGGALLWCGLALLTLDPWALGLGMVLSVGLLLRIKGSRRQCLRAATALVARSAAAAGLVDSGNALPTGSPTEPAPADEATNESALATAAAGPRAINH